MKLTHGTIEGAESAKRVANNLIQSSMYFEMEPRPDDFYQFSVKIENTEYLGVLIGKIEQGN